MKTRWNSQRKIIKHERQETTKKHGMMPTGLVLLVSLALFSLAGFAQGATHSFTPLASPVLDADEAVAKPIAVGPVATGGTLVNIQIATAPFTEPMDFYVAVYSRTVDPTLYILKPNNDLQPISAGLVPWRRGVTSVNEAPFASMPVGTLSSGSYQVFLAVAPAGSLAPTAVFETFFDVGPAGDIDGDTVPNDEDTNPFVALEAASLKDIPVPEPVNLGLFLKSAAGVNAAGFPNVSPLAKAAAIKLGKALFWDMNMGSDVQACASCHYQAGADGIRSRNQVNPGGDGTFQVAGPNLEVTPGDFPFIQFTPVDEGIARGGVRALANFDDVMGSQGVFFTEFVDIVLGSPLEQGTPIPDPVFNVAGVNSRRNTGRNAPSAVNAVFNFTNFWDGRARNIFNGVNPFGELDQNSGVFVQTGGVIDPQQEIVRIPDSSLASQAVGPPGSDVEMTFAGRPFAKIGKKLLAASLKPLSRQKVDPTDSVLGDLADTPTGLQTIFSGENAYVSLIKEAFQEKYWNAPSQHITLPDGAVAAGAANPSDTDQYTQMEANFSLFFGLAVQLYEATLVSDDTKFDRVMEGREQFTDAEKAGFTTFFGGGHCDMCHFGPEFTNQSIREIRGGVVPQAPGFLPDFAIDQASFDGGNALIDIGFSNIAVVPTANDLGWGGNSPFINPLTGQPFPLAFAKLALLKQDGLLPADVAMFVPDLPGGGNLTRVAVDGTFKTPGLRNVELNGPFFHNGGASTLMQVVEFYTRGGNFPQENAANLDPNLQDIGKLRGAADKRAELVQFLLTLTDDRVKFEKAPFDHPQFFFPAGDGLQGTPGSLGFAPGESFIELPAVGAAGRDTPLKPFLNLNQITGQVLP